MINNYKNIDYYFLVLYYLFLVFILRKLFSFLFIFFFHYIYCYFFNKLFSESSVFSMLCFIFTVHSSFSYSVEYWAYQGKHKDKKESENKENKRYYSLFVLPIVPNFLNLTFFLCYLRAVLFFHFLSLFFLFPLNFLQLKLTATFCSLLTLCRFLLLPFPSLSFCFYPHPSFSLSSSLLFSPSLDQKWRIQNF